MKIYSPHFSYIEFHFKFYFICIFLTFFVFYYPFHKKEKCAKIKRGMFMKKIIWIFPILLFTCACSESNEPLTCTIQEEVEEIRTEITIVTEFEKGKATSAKAQATMFFATNEDAQSYYDAYTEEKANVELEENKIHIHLENHFEEIGQSRNKTKESFENSGYTCK